MKAKVKGSYAGGLVRAFTGREYVRYEYRIVPEGCEAEAHRLNELGLLELLKNSSPDIPDDIEELREAAKEAGISYYWQKKAENLLAELDALDEEE